MKVIIESLHLQKAAEQLLRDEAMDKEFWAVNDYQDNREVLQTLIGKQNCVFHVN